MVKFNPFRTIINLEKGNARFKETGPLEGIGVAFSYIVLLTVIMTLFSAFQSDNYVVLSIIGSIGTIISFYIILKALFGSYVDIYDGESRYKSKNNKFILKNILFISISFIGLLLLLDSALMPVLKMVKGYDILTDSFKMIAKMPLYTIVYVIFLGPIMEELVFRGAILNGLIERGYSRVFAILFSSFIFGVVHLNLPQFFLAFILGIFLGYINVKTRSMLLCFYVHIIHNAISIVGILMPKYFSVFSGNIISIIMFSLMGLLLMIFALKRILSNEETLNYQNI